MLTWNALTVPLLSLSQIQTLPPQHPMDSRHVKKLLTITFSRAICDGSFLLALQFRRELLDLTERQWRNVDLDSKSGLFVTRRWTLRSWYCDVSHVHVLPGYWWEVCKEPSQEGKLSFTAVCRMNTGGKLHRGGRSECLRWYPRGALS